MGMTLDEAIKYAENMAALSHKGSGNTECEQNHRQLAEWLKDYKRLKEQEPCELLIIKSDILLHQDVRKKWMESIKREKESGVIILPPYFKPLLVPNDIEINIEQEPCEDCISRQKVLDILKDKWNMFSDANDAMQESIDTIEAFSSVIPKPKMGWIPVSERVPKAGEYVGNVAKYYLVQNEHGDMLVARYTYSGYWEQIYQLKPIGDEIVAWMPLPEPYKAERRRNDTDRHRNA